MERTDTGSGALASTMILRTHLLVGLLLCFTGVASLHGALLTSGFALAWWLADALGASTGVALVIALGGAVLAWFLVTLVFRLAAFAVGAISGAVIGARLYGLLEGRSSSVVVALVFVVAVAALAGFLTHRFTPRLLLWVCALGGAGLALTGLARLAPDTLGFLRDPQTAAGGVIAWLAWVALAVLGGLVQRRAFPRTLARGRTS